MIANRANIMLLLPQSNQANHNIRQQRSALLLCMLSPAHSHHVLVYAAPTDAKPRQRQNTHWAIAVQQGGSSKPCVCRRLQQIRQTAVTRTAPPPQQTADLEVVLLSSCCNKTRSSQLATHTHTHTYTIVRQHMGTKQS